MSKSNNARRPQAYLSIGGTTSIHFKNPYITACWSALFPGFGHFQLSKYIRATLLTLWVVLVNTNAHVNLAIVYSMTGRIELAKEVLDVRWFLLYIPVWFFAVWDSYHTTVTLNNIYKLAAGENADFDVFKISAMEINYLEKRRPIMSVFWSLAMPGMGYLHLHRLFLAFYALIWWIITTYYSHLLEAIHFLVDGDISRATNILNPEWFLYMPAIYLGSTYDAYVYTVENNKLFEVNQYNFLRKNYQESTIKLPFGK